MSEMQDKWDEVLADAALGFSDIYDRVDADYDPLDDDDFGITDEMLYGLLDEDKPNKYHKVVALWAFEWLSRIGYVALGIYVAHTWLGV